MFKDMTKPDYEKEHKLQEFIDKKAKLLTKRKVRLNVILEEYIPKDNTIAILNIDGDFAKGKFEYVIFFYLGAFSKYNISILKNITLHELAHIPRYEARYNTYKRTGNYGNYIPPHGTNFKKACRLLEIPEMYTTPGSAKKNKQHWKKLGAPKKEQ